MVNEKEVVTHIEEYKELGEENKKVDVSALALNALAMAERGEVSAKKKYWSYFVAVSLPPLGLIPAVYYYFSRKGDGKKVALICLILTIVSGGITWYLTQQLLSSFNVSEADLQNLNIDEYKSLLQ